MALSKELISQFVKITNDKKEKNSDTIIYGTVSDKPGYVIFDGADSNRLTPVSSTSELISGDRVTVLIKNHQAVVTGNLDGKSTSISYIEKVINEPSGDGELFADKVSLSDLKRFLNDPSTSIDIGKISAYLAEIETLVAKKLDAEQAEILRAEISELVAGKLEAGAATIDKAEIKKLATEKLNAETAKIVYATIDFANVDSVAMEYLYSRSGLIDNIVVGDGSITGILVGVTIKGDSIEAGTLVADKLVIKGEDGLYYKLNTDGMTTEAEQTEYNSLNGSIIAAKSITASKIDVNDLVAFDATIGGFHITNNSIYSEVKDSEGNTTRGIYMDADGQLNFGDISNFIKYYRDEDGNYKLAISAESIMYSLNGSQRDIADLGLIGEYVQIGTYEGEPCIELGEKDSDFKLLITNTRILFMEGTTVPAHITNQSLHIKKAVIEEEFEQGGFVWKTRSNGNVGLVWKGVSN